MRIKTVYQQLSGGAVYVKNMYVDLTGTLHPLPFNGTQGLWRFDGQFFIPPNHS